MRSNGSAFVAIMDALLRGRHGIVAVIETYFDESMRGDFTCVAGYAFVKSRCKRFDSEWGELLRSYHLPYFRMSACAHGNKPFDVLSPQQCINAEKRAIGLINQYASHGIAVGTTTAEFQRSYSKSEHISTPYEFCVWAILAGVQSWLGDSGVKGSVAYFFEAGHKHQGRANMMMKKIFAAPELKARYRYAGHAFVDKVQSRPAQAADLLAWQFATEYRRLREGRPYARKDYANLVRLHHEVVFPSITPIPASGYRRFT